jgi:S1-C subfamily serine protease
VILWSASVLAALAALALAEAPARAGEPRPRAVSPEVFGDVFRATRSALVRISTGDPVHPYGTGFLIGARGEVVFGAKKAPAVGSWIEVATADGRSRSATVLGFDEAVKLAVARIAGDDGSPMATEPLRVARTPGLADSVWVVVLVYEDKGFPAPYAGLVDGPPEVKKLKGQPRLLARVDAPGAIGSPVLSIDGTLIGVVVDEGKRRSRAIAIESLTPFLKAVVLGG